MLVDVQVELTAHVDALDLHHRAAVRGGNRYFLRLDADERIESALVTLGRLATEGRLPRRNWVVRQSRAASARDERSSCLVRTT